MTIVNGPSGDRMISAPKCLVAKLKSFQKCQKWKKNRARKKWTNFSKTKSFREQKKTSNLGNLKIIFFGLWNIEKIKCVGKNICKKVESRINEGSLQCAKVIRFVKFKSLFWGNYYNNLGPLFLFKQESGL